MGRVWHVLAGIDPGMADIAGDKTAMHVEYGPRFCLFAVGEGTVANDADRLVLFRDIDILIHHMKMIPRHDTLIMAEQFQDVIHLGLRAVVKGFLTSTPCK